MRRTHVCSFVGKHGETCPELAPCPTHSRPRNASWSKDRDRDTQRAFRNATLSRDNFTCQRCGHYDESGRSLDAHHVTPTVGTTLCNSKAKGCHKAVDPSAR